MVTNVDPVQSYAVPDAPDVRFSGSPFDDLSASERREASRTLLRAEQTATNERTDLTLATDALAIEERLGKRGMDDPAARSAAADTIALATANEQALVGQVAEFRELLHGQDNSVTLALDKYIHQLRDARDGDMDALARAEQANGSLEGARRENEAADEQGRYTVRDMDAVVTTTSDAALAKHVLGLRGDYGYITERDGDDHRVVATNGALQAEPGWTSSGLSPAFELAARHAERMHDSVEAAHDARIEQAQQHQDALMQTKEGRAALVEALAQSGAVADQARPVGAAQDVFVAGNSSVGMSQSDAALQDLANKGGQAAAAAGLDPASVTVTRTEPAKVDGNTVDLNADAIDKRLHGLNEDERRERTINPDSEAAQEAIRKRKRAEVEAMEQSASQEFPADFDKRYAKIGNRVVDLNARDRTVIHDKGTRLQAPQTFDTEAVQLIVATAEARGWKEINVKGSPEFRQAVWTAAQSKGLDVAGYKPTEAEQAWADKQRDKAGKVNSVSNHEAVQAFREANNSADRKAAAEKFPELKKAFAVEAGMAAMSRQIQGTQAQQAFMARMRENIATDLAQGREMADIQLRKPMFKDQEPTRDHDRGRSR